MQIGSVNLNNPGPASADVPVVEVPTEDRELIQAVKALNRTEVFGYNNELTFVLDRETHRPLVRIVDRETREVIRQIPPEYALRMAEELKTSR